MTFKVTYTGGFNPFEWEALRCPVCGESEFASQDHTGVFCEVCYADFEVRATAGDPGCVVDCFTKEVHAPVWECMDCGKEAGFFDWQKPLCPGNSRHTMKKASTGRLVKMPWKHPRGFPRSFYLVLKLGDYCSGWLNGRTCHQYRNYPTQEKWDRFQEETKIAWPRYGARYALV